MIKKMILKHKDIPCGVVFLDEASGRIAAYKDFHTGFSPFLGNMDFSKMVKWWEMRAVPVSRNIIKKKMKNFECLNPLIFLAKNLALSVTDSYWLCPVEMDLKYEEVKFSYNLNASLGGQMEKHWHLTVDGPVLIKESSKYFGQQSINEAMATYIHKRQGTDMPYVVYTAIKTEDNSVLCKCRCFTSDRLEFVSAYEVLESGKVSNEKSLYEQYIERCVENGIPGEIMQKFMDYQTLTDFVISNTDEHLLNFGILRDSDTLRFVCPAPIFDSGNSMFYDENGITPYSRIELLKRKITGFYADEEKMLSKVHDKNVVKIDLLPSPSEVQALYQESGLPEQKAAFISENYQTKLQMLQEFQKGTVISVYYEKKREQENS